MSKSTDSLWQVFVIIFCFRKSVEKVCVSWALPLIECVAVWALKLPVPHTDVLKTHSSQTFSTNLPEPKRVKTNTCHKLLAKNTFFLSCIVTEMKLQFPIWRCCKKIKTNREMGRLVQALDVIFSVQKFVLIV